jgi:hypothetical protein
MVAYCHCLFHSTTTTIEKGDGIDVVSFFVTKLLKKVTAIVITFFYNKAIEEGDGNCFRFLLLLKHREEGDTTFVITTPPHKKAKQKVTTVAVLLLCKTPTIRR